MRIAFLGLGNMGGPMAANLIRAGHMVAGYDLGRAQLKTLADAGGTATTSIAAAVRDAGIVITMLPAGQHVKDAVTGPDGVLAHVSPDALLIDCSTIDVATARAVAAAVEARGCQFVDAPVSGGVGGASAGTLTFMVGGTDGAVGKAHPILECMGKTIVHCGGPGTGQAAKICNNMILGISMIAVSEAFNLADGLGLDRQKLFDVAAKSSGQCWSLTSYCPVPGPVPTSPANRDYAPGFTAAMMLKDLNLAQAAATGAKTATPLGAEAAAIYEAFVAQGGSAIDFSGIIRHLGARK